MVWIVIKCLRTLKYAFMKCNGNIFNAQLLKVNTLVDGIYAAKEAYFEDKRIEKCHIRDGQNVYWTYML